MASRRDVASEWLRSRASLAASSVRTAVAPPFRSWVGTVDGDLSSGWGAVRHGASAAAVSTWASRRYPRDLAIRGGDGLWLAKDWIEYEVPPEALDTALAAGTVGAATYACTYLAASSACGRVVPTVGRLALRQAYRFMGRRANAGAFESGILLGGAVGAGGFTGIGVGPLADMLDRWDRERGTKDAVDVDPLTVSPKSGTRDRRPVVDEEVPR